jgi:hypothetical protein
VERVRRALIEHAGQIAPIAPLSRQWQVSLNEEYAYQADLQEVLEKVRYFAWTGNLPMDLLLERLCGR